MRILVVGPPASGLHVAARLLAKHFDLRLLSASTDKIPSQEARFSQFLRSGRMESGAVLAHNFAPDADLIAACQQADCRIVCMTRNPHVMFEAVYAAANDPSGALPAADVPMLRGANLTDDAVKQFIRDRYRLQLQRISSWCSSGSALPWRFEDLQADPEISLAQIAGALAAAPEASRESVADADRVPRSAKRRNAELADAFRLPAEVVREINQLIDPVLESLGYARQPWTESGRRAERWRRFAAFLDRYADSQRLFIVGYGKSGTTWVHLMLFNHASVAAVAERRLIEHPDGNAALFDQMLDERSYRSWFESSSFGKSSPAEYGVRFEMAGLLGDYLLFRALASRRTDKGFHRREEITHISEKIALNRADDAAATMAMIDQAYPGARVIHIVRDPRDVAISGLYHLRRTAVERDQSHWASRYLESIRDKTGPSPLDSRQATGYFKSLANSWTKIVQAFHCSGIEDFAGRYHLVRYEDLVASPRDRLVELLKFCELDSSEATLQAILARTAFKALSAGRAPGEEDVGSFYRKGVSGDWVSYMTEHDSRKLFAPARSLMSDLGYW